MQTLTLTGDLTPEDAAQLNNVLNVVQGLTLNLADSDIPTGTAMAALVRVLKDALVAGRSIELQSPPQLLVHNLYRVGMHPHQHLKVLDLRTEEPYG
jgi:ABC-type transporter Mla MlaB component